MNKVVIWGGTAPGLGDSKETPGAGQARLRSLSSRATPRPPCLYTSKEVTVSLNETVHTCGGSL